MEQCPGGRRLTTEKKWIMATIEIHTPNGEKWVLTTIEMHTRSNEESEGTEKSGKLPGESKISEELPITRQKRCSEGAVDDRYKN